MSFVKCRLTGVGPCCKEGELTETALISIALKEDVTSTFDEVRINL
jgi:hypothetical protein